jgi:hypothetical protein
VAFHEKVMWRPRCGPRSSVSPARQPNTSAYGFRQERLDVDVVVEEVGADQL